MFLDKKSKSSIPKFKSYFCNAASEKYILQSFYQPYEPCILLLLLYEFTFCFFYDKNTPIL